MLVDDIRLFLCGFEATAVRSGSNVDVSFPTRAGFSYQVFSDTDVSGSYSTSEGSPVTGDGTVQTVSVAVGIDIIKYFKVRASNVIDCN